MTPPKLNLKSRLAIFAADHLPRRVIYWAMIRVGIEHCGGSSYPTEIVPNVPFVTVLDRCYRALPQAKPAPDDGMW